MKTTILLSSLAATVLVFNPCLAHADMANGSDSVNAGAYVCRNIMTATETG